MAVNRAVSSHLPWLIVNQSRTTSRVGMFPYILIELQG